MGEDNNEDDDDDDDEDDPTTFSTTTCSFGFSMGSTTLTDAAGAPSAMGTTRLPAMPIRGILVFQL